MAKVALLLFGEPRLIVAGQTIRPDRRKALALLATLALAEQRQSRDHLAGMLWPALNQQRARAALRSTIYALGPTGSDIWLSKQHDTLALDRSAIDVDVHTFLGLLQRSRTHQHGHELLCDACAHWLSQAIDSYQSDFMAGFFAGDSPDYDEWQVLQREWLRRELASSLARLAQYLSMGRDAEQALAYARRWLDLDPLHEPAHRMLMRIYAAHGQRSNALRQYHSCAELLSSELATVPEEETTSLYRGLRDATRPAPPPERLSAPLAMVLPPLPGLVVGREAAMADLKLRLGFSHRSASPMTIIPGWPGVGKSTLVAALAHDAAIAERFPDGVLWASLGQTPDLLGELRIWADALGVSSRTHEQSLEQLQLLLIGALRERCMLLIVDDVWQVDHLHPFNIGGQECALLITSRLNEVATALAPTAADVYRLDVLAEDAALHLLEKLTPETVAAHPQAARDLVRDLEGLPLAIQVAGRLLQVETRLGWGIDQLLTEVRTGAHLLQAHAPADLVKLGQTQTPTVAALLKRSTDALAPHLQEAFALLGLFVPKPATFDLGALAAAWDVADPRPIVRILVNRGLLEPIGNGRFQMHALLMMHAQMLLARDAP